MTTKIKPGDRVSILSARGSVVTGTVLTSNNYGEELTPDWYIELNQDGFGYIYWKQSRDGGTVEKLSKPRLALLGEYKYANHERDQILDAVLGTIHILASIPGVRDALTVAAVKHWSTWTIRDFAEHTDADEFGGIPIDFAFQYVTNPDENEDEEEPE